MSCLEADFSVSSSLRKNTKLIIVVVFRSFKGRMYRPRILNPEVEKLHVVVETMCYFFWKTSQGAHLPLFLEE